MKKPKRFTGALAKSIPGVNHLLVALIQRDDPQALEKEYQRISGELAQKLRLLAQHYGIDPEPKNPDGMGQVYGLHPDWTLLLLLRLAQDLVPGLQVIGKLPRGRGRPKGTGKIDKRKLYEAVEGLRRRRGLTIESACKDLAKRVEWKGHTWQSLKTRYYEQVWEFDTINQLSTKITPLNFSTSF